MGRRAQVQAFLRSETVGGALLIVAALIGIICANSPLKEAFHGLATTVVGIDSLHLTLTVEEWAADGLLTIFFFIIGCELKYELVVGSLSKPRQALLPVAAAIGGMLLPALIYLGINSAVATGNVRGWGIPMATDIAFALAVLAVLGRGLPAGARIFLLTMAIVDDLGAILVIALFYSNSVAVDWLIVAALLCVLFAFAQRMRLTSPLIYIPLVLGAWYATHSSGVHATIAGVVLGLLMRARTDSGESEAPVVRIMHRLHPLSAAVAVPAFALFAAAVDLRSINIGETLTSPILLGALLGLVIGKPFGIFLAARAAAAVGATLAPGVRWIDIAIVGTVGGIGFTMSLLISELAFVGAADLGAAKLGVLAASLLAVAGSILMLTIRSKQSSSQ
jgi:NhaA family Na+:H+ antiporter